MEDSLASKFRYLMSIRHLKRRVAANVKWLEEVSGMGWHTESDNLVLCAELIELRCSMAAVAVKDK
jgi:hypothetical protein